MKIPSTPQFQAAKIASDALKRAGFEAYLIGGAVRDLLLHKTPKDVDLATNATPDQVQSMPEFKSAFYKDTAQAYGVTRVRIEVADAHEQTSRLIELEIATFREDVEAHKGRKATKVHFSTLEQDIKRRDFTINGLALDLSNEKIVDLIGGEADIERKQLRFIGTPLTRLEEDPLRILRAIRFKNQLAFTYEAATAAALLQAGKAGLPEQIASPRLKIELTHILTHPSRAEALRDLDRFGVLSSLLPEVAAMKEVAQPQELHAEGDVFTHTKLALGYLPEIVSPRLAWATLLHDVAKPTTFRASPHSGDRIRFDNHYSVGAEMSEVILKRLHFNARFRSEVAWMVHYHLAIDDLPKMRPRKADQFMHHPAFADLLELHKADAHAAWSTLPDGSIDRGRADFSQLEELWRDFQQRKAQHPPSLKQDLGIDGHWLMSNFDIKSPPEVGRILTELEQAYLNHEVHTTKEARHLAQKLVAKHL